MLYNFKILTCPTGIFSSQTGINASRIGWFAGHNTFVSFFDTSFMTNGIQIIITIWKYTSKFAWKTDQVVGVVDVLTGNLDQFVGWFQVKGPPLWRVRQDFSFWNIWISRFVFMISNRWRILNVTKFALGNANQTFVFMISNKCSFLIVAKFSFAVNQKHYNYSRQTISEVKYSSIVHYEDYESYNIRHAWPYLNLSGIKNQSTRYK